MSGWETTGKVTANANTATLSEVASSQTRLNQVFVVGADDRYLSFTLSNIALEDVVNNPDDAFEVALLNANTGTSLTAPIGLTRTDSLLNIQANGNELKATGVTSVINADGSRTYVVDLQGIGQAGIAGGTAVNLSFDLIGFGNTAANINSHVTVRDVRLTPAIITPQLSNDEATGAEDSVMQIIALANDLNIVQANTSFSPIIVAAPTHGSVSINADGSFSYTPTANYFGADSFTYKVSNGLAGNALVESNLATVNLTVTAVNDAPVAGNINLNLAEDTAITLNLLEGASDIEASMLTPVIVMQPAHGVLALNTNGSFTYTPTANYNGTDSFTYKVNDAELDSAIATVSLTIAAVNDAPVVAPRTVTIDEDATASFNLLATATDVDGDTLSATVVTQPAHGSLTLNADGTYTYTPAANFNGTDSLSYEVSDGTVVISSTINFIINAVNDAPVLVSRHLSLDEDSQLNINLLASATDVDGDVLSATVVTQPAHGSLTLNVDGTYTYTPTANFNGTDSFSYFVNDGKADSNTARISFNIAAVNDAPVATDKAITLAEDSTQTIDLLALVSDIDSTTLTPIIVTAPAHGTLTQLAKINGVRHDNLLFRETINGVRHKET